MKTIKILTMTLLFAFQAVACSGGDKVITVEALPAAARDTLRSALRRKTRKAPAQLRLGSGAAQQPVPSMPGVVRFVQDDGFYGSFVTVDHGDGTQAVYANLASIPAVNPGDWIMAGDVIGAVGTTALCEIGQGTHLHFAMYLDGQSVDPLDYLPV